MFVLLCPFAGSNTCRCAVTLAYTLAASHGLDADAERIAAALNEAGLGTPELLPNAKSLIPPTPVLKQRNWPLLAVSKGVFEGATLPAEEPTSQKIAAAAADEATDADAWGGDDLDLGFDTDSKREWCADLRCFVYSRQLQRQRLQSQKWLATGVAISTSAWRMCT